MKTIIQRILVFCIIICIFYKSLFNMIPEDKQYSEEYNKKIENLELCINSLADNHKYIRSIKTIEIIKKIVIGGTLIIGVGYYLYGKEKNIEAGLPIFSLGTNNTLIRKFLRIIKLETLCEQTLNTLNARTGLISDIYNHYKNILIPVTLPILMYITTHNIKKVFNVWKHGSFLLTCTPLKDIKDQYYRVLYEALQTTDIDTKFLSTTNHQFNPTSTGTWSSSLRAISPNFPDFILNFLNSVCNYINHNSDYFCSLAYLNAKEDYPQCNKIYTFICETIHNQQETIKKIRALHYNNKEIIYGESGTRDNMIKYNNPTCILHILNQYANLQEKKKLLVRAIYKSIIITAAICLLIIIMQEEHLIGMNGIQHSILLKLTQKIKQLIPLPTHSAINTLEKIIVGNVDKIFFLSYLLKFLLIPTFIGLLCSSITDEYETLHFRYATNNLQIYLSNKFNNLKESNAINDCDDTNSSKMTLRIFETATESFTDEESFSLDPENDPKITYHLNITMQQLFDAISNPPKYVEAIENKENQKLLTFTEKRQKLKENEKK
jgi:hypothetical protein